MPGLRENVKKVLDKGPEQEQSKQLDIEQSGYSKRSPILKAYMAGTMPVDHKILLDAIKRELGDKQEGVIHLEDVLQATGYARASALKMLRHMQNFGVLETERRYRGTWVKILSYNV